MPSTPGPHLGILREENIMLRQILGYRLDTLTSSPYKPPETGGYLPDTNIKDLLIISVDVDTGGGYEAISPQQNFHIGISVFDTRALLLEKPLKSPRDLIVSYQFINRQSKPCKYAEKKFLFGETELMSLPEIATRICTITKDRQYILVAHGAREDIKFFNNLHPEIVSRAYCIIDTVKAEQFPLKLYYRYSLEKLLDELSIPYAKLHAAGNDAHFVLKALLMIAVRDGKLAAESATPEENLLFDALEDIAHADCDIPVWTVDPPPQPKLIPTKPKIGLKEKGRLRKKRRVELRALRAIQAADEADSRQDEEMDNGAEISGHEIQ